MILSENSPQKCSSDDKKYLKNFTDEAGDQSIEKNELLRIFKKLGVDNNLDLIKGNILKTLPNFIKANKHLKISLLHVDVDAYEPTRLCLEILYPHVVKNGVVILDDYGAFRVLTKQLMNFSIRNLTSLKPCLTQVI